MNSRVLSLVLALLFIGPSTVFSVSLLGNRTIDPSDIVVLGGSFSPPTIEHGGVLARIVQRFGFSEGRKLTATPYKEGAVSSDITLELTRISVTNFDEILDLYSIPYRSFESPEDGQAVFSLADGKRVTIKVDDSDIRNGIKEDTLRSLQNLHREKGDARKVFWISGGDSFSSVPQWTSEWRQLFDHANWIVVTRPGYDTGDKQINFFRDNPLSAVFDNEFLNRYDYTFDQVNLVHHYRNKDSSKPDIFVINQVALNDSSSLNRKSLAEQGDHDHAQAGLQPSVFARCLSAGYYSSKAIPGEYNLFSRKNLSIFLRWLRTNIEKTNHENRLDPEDQEVYGQMLHALVASSEVVAEGLKNRSRIEAVQNKIKETVIDFKTNLKVLTNRKSLVRRFNDLVSSTGARGLAIALIIGQVLELSVIPATVAKIYGAPGLAAVPGLQTEFLILPIWLGWKLFKNYRERTRLAGNLKNYSLVNDYLHQLLRGDPLAIESRIEFGEGSGFGKSPITLNLIRSRLPKWIPLFLRRMDDRRIRWHDLNISTNELRAIINDSTLSDLLGEAAGKHNAVLSDLLFVAAQRNEESLWKFHFLLGHRYFRRLYLGDISSELLAGFTEDERKIVQEIAVKNRELARVIDKKDLENLGDLVADIYSVLRLVSMDPSAFESDNFWTVILNFIATRYPDVDGNLLSDKGRVWLSEYLPLFAETLNLIAPEVFDGTTIKYNGRQLIEFKEFSVDLNIEQSEETLKQRRFKNIVRDYISQHHAVLRSAVQQPTESNYRVLPVHSRGKDIQEGNMAWEMTQFLHYADHRNHVLTLGFDSALKRLDSQPHHEKTERIFRAAFSHVQKRIENDFSRLEDSKFLWVKEKLVFHTGLNKSDESEIPSYLRFVDEFEVIRKSVEESLAKISRLNSLMMGTEPLDVRSLESVQKAVGGVVGSDINISLKKSCVRAVKHLLGRFD